MFTIKKPIICSWISEKSWESLSMKEKDFVIFHFSKKFTKRQIMRKLYIEDRTSYWRIQTSVRDKIKSDVANYNEQIKNSLNKAKIE